MTTLNDIVLARGGNPACLHCQLSTLVSLHFENRPEGPEHAITIAGALAEVCGDLVAPAPEDRREPCLQKLAMLMRQKCALMVSTRAQEDEAADEPPPPPRRLN